MNDTAEKLQSLSCILSDLAAYRDRAESKTDIAYAMIHLQNERGLLLEKLEGGK